MKETEEKTESRMTESESKSVLKNGSKSVMSSLVTDMFFRVLVAVEIHTSIRCLSNYREKCQGICRKENLSLSLTETDFHSLPLTTTILHLILMWFCCPIKK